MEHSIVRFDTESVSVLKQSRIDEDDAGGDLDSRQRIDSHDSIHAQNESSTFQHEWQSLSCLTDSTEHSVPINFDMSNRVCVKMLST